MASVPTSTAQQQPGQDSVRVVALLLAVVAFLMIPAASSPALQPPPPPPPPQPQQPTTSPVPCSTDEDCSLNGLCTAGYCVCDDGWTTLPHGLNNELAPACGYLDFLPAAATSCGPACAFHGGVNDNHSTSSWGGSVIELASPNGTNEYWMFASEFAK
jgi:hypothetical protein